MNRIAKGLKAAVVIAAILVAGVLSRPAEAGVDFGFVYSNLSPHGSWMVSAQYGRVWQPSVYAPGWNPYYDGHWVYSDVGWTWVSDYDWGAVPYHYGTWYEDPSLGWIWVPGYTWAPSWVVFRTGPDFIGWAPVAPGFSVGVSVGAPVAGGFVFVSCHDFLGPRVRTAVVPSSRTYVAVSNTRVVNNISIQNNVVVNRGPDVSTIERASGRRVQAVPIEQVSRAHPGGHFSRADISVDSSRRGGRGVKASEPYSAKAPLPVNGAKAPAAPSRRSVAPGQGAEAGRKGHKDRKAAAGPAASGPREAAALSTPRRNEPTSSRRPPDRPAVASSQRPLGRSAAHPAPRPAIHPVASPAKRPMSRSVAAPTQRPSTQARHVPPKTKKERRSGGGTNVR
jgi:uncharacterized protein DUF6600